MLKNILWLLPRWTTTVFLPVEYPKCADTNSIVKFGQTSNGKQRFFCQIKKCTTSTFIINHERKGWQPGIKEKIIGMTLNGSAIGDISRVLGVCTETVHVRNKKKKTQSYNQLVMKGIFSKRNYLWEKRILKKIERKHLTLRTWIKQLARKSIFFQSQRKCMILLLECSLIVMNL